MIKKSIAIYLQYVDLAHPSLNHWQLLLLRVLLSGDCSGLTWSLFLTARSFLMRMREFHVIIIIISRV